MPKNKANKKKNNNIMFIVIILLISFLSYTAKSIADSAKSTADSAKSTADSAQSTANSAQSDLDLKLVEGNIVPDNSSNSFTVFPSTTSVGSIEFKLNRGTEDIIRLSNNQGRIELYAPTNGVKLTGSLELTLHDIQEFPNDAAARDGFIPIGGVYRTGSVLKIRTV